MLRLITLAFLLVAGPVAFAQDDRKVLAESIDQESDLQKLIDTSAGGGRTYRVGESDFFVADLQTHSGLKMTESYIFKKTGGKLVFRAVVPASFSRDRRIEYESGYLVVSERGQDDINWSVVFELVH